MFRWLSFITGSRIKLGISRLKSHDCVNTIASSSSGNLNLDFSLQAWFNIFQFQILGHPQCGFKTSSLQRNIFWCACRSQIYSYIYLLTNCLDSKALVKQLYSLPSSANGTVSYLQRYCVFENEHIDFTIERISVVHTLVTSCHAPFYLPGALVCFYRRNAIPPGTCT